MTNKHQWRLALLLLSTAFALYLAVNEPGPATAELNILRRAAPLSVQDYQPLPNSLTQSIIDPTQMRFYTLSFDPQSNKVTLTAYNDRYLRSWFLTHDDAGCDWANHVLTSNQQSVFLFTRCPRGFSVLQMQASDGRVQSKSILGQDVRLAGLNPHDGSVLVVRRLQAVPNEKQVDKKFVHVLARMEAVGDMKGYQSNQPETSLDDRLKFGIELESVKTGSTTFQFKQMLFGKTSDDIYILAYQRTPTSTTTLLYRLNVKGEKRWERAWPNQQRPLILVYNPITLRVDVIDTSLGHGLKLLVTSIDRESGALMEEYMPQQYFRVVNATDKLIVVGYYEQDEQTLGLKYMGVLPVDLNGQDSPNVLIQSISNPPPTKTVSSTLTMTNSGQKNGAVIGVVVLMLSCFALTMN